MIEIGYLRLSRRWCIISHIVLLKIGEYMDIKVGDRLLMKKKHPCGADTFTVLRIGMDFRIRCDGCGREIMVPRLKAEKSLKKIIVADGEKNV